MRQNNTGIEMNSLIAMESSNDAKYLFKDLDSPKSEDLSKNNCQT